MSYTRPERLVAVAPGMVGSAVMDIAGIFAHFPFLAHVIAAPVQVACIWGSLRLTR